MNTKELLDRVEQRLNGEGNAHLPPEETLKAIQALGISYGSEKKKTSDLEEQVAELKAKVSNLEDNVEDAEYRARQANDKAKEQEWIAHELGKFIGDVANSLYVGQEVAAANRVYDLNKGSLKKKRLNAYNFDSLQEAKAAYAEYCREKGFPIDEINMIPWLFNYAARP